MSDKTPTGRLRELLDGAGAAHVDYGGITEFTGASGCTSHRKTMTALWSMMSQ